MKSFVIAILLTLAAGTLQTASATAWTLTFSTYFGGNNMTAATAVAVDGTGDIFMAGWTNSTLFRGCSPKRPSAGGVDAFVVKWDGVTHLIDYCTFLGGRGDDRAFAIAVDGSGYAYVTGRTMSSNFPVALPMQTTLAGVANAFVAKLSPTGALVYSSYLGGDGSDSGNGIAVDTAGNMTVVGSTTSTNFPLAGPLQSTLNGQTNLFISRLNPAGNSFLYSTYLGGSGNDYATAVALDQAGAVYVTGGTTSTDFPISSTIQPAIGGNQNAFVMKLSSAGNQIVYSTYLGGSGGTVAFPESGSGIAVDSAGDAYVTGTTVSQSFPLFNPLFSTSAGVGIHAFVTELNPAGSALLYSTFLGGSSFDEGTAIAVDSYGNAVAVGYTSAPDFPVTNATQASLAGGYDAYVTRFNAAGTALLGSTFFGGSASDAANAVAYAPSDAICVAGQTQSVNLPLVNATQSILAGAQNAFLAVYSVSLTTAPVTPSGLTATPGSASVTLNWTVSSGATSYNVYRGTTAGGESATPLATGIATASYSDIAVTNGTKYYYKVAAVNGGGNSAESAEASATPQATAPAAPTSLTATPGNASVTLNWTASSGATSYNVYRGITAGGESATPLATGIASVSYPDTTVTNGTKYYYKIAAVNAGGIGAQSAEASATPQPPAPSAPAGLTATAGNATVTLNWTASSGATSYNVYRGTTAAGESAIPLATGITSVSYSDTTVSNGTRYYYTVAAAGIAGIGVQSTEVSATPQPPPPIAPTGVTATAGNAAVTLNWTASSGATSYNVYRGTTTGGESATPLATGITAISYPDNTVTNDTKYYYKVAAVNGGGTGAQSAEVSATPEPLPPAAPVGLTATAGNASVTLNWTASTGATSYNVYRGTTAGGESATALATGLTAVSYPDAAVINGTKYYYKVAAANTAGTGAQSAEASATPEPPVPATPTGLTATAGNASVTLNWTASSGAPSYNVYRGTTAGGESPTPLATGITAVSYADTAATNGTKYYYTVTAVNGGGASSQSAEASATPQPPAAGAPTGLTATAGNASVTLNWTASIGATSYNVYRGTTAGGESATPLATGITAVSYPDAAVTNGTTYYYKVAAVNGGGTSAQSTEVSATPQVAAPSAPTGLTATAGNSSVTLNWTASSGATSYNVYRGAAAGGESATPLATGITSVSYPDTAVTNGTTYYYKVAAVNGGGTSSQSAEASATPEPPAPAAPTNLTAKAGYSSVTLNWTASSGATSYNVYRGTTAGGESATPLATGLTSISYADTAVTNGTTYYYKVAALDIGAVSALSSESSATPQSPTPPAPTGLSATGTVAGASAIPIANASFESPVCPSGACMPAGWIANGAGIWAPLSNVFPTIPAGTQVECATAGASLTQILATALALNTTYTLTVQAGARSGLSFGPVVQLLAGSTVVGTASGVTPAGGKWTPWTLVYDSGGSNAAVGQPLQISLASSVTQTNFDAVSLTAVPDANVNGSVALSWNASSGAISYNVYRGTSAGGESMTPIASGITATSYTDNTLSSSTTYYYKVAAVNAVGTGALSTEVSVVP
jgi:fibronectin type 3 domain-containing protein